MTAEFPRAKQETTPKALNLPVGTPSADVPGAPVPLDSKTSPGAPQPFAVPESELSPDASLPQLKDRDTPLPAAFMGIEPEAIPSAAGDTPNPRATAEVGTILPIPADVFTPAVSSDKDVQRGFSVLSSQKNKPDNINRVSLGELGKIFEPDFTTGEITMPSGRTLVCKVDDHIVSIEDKANPDYRYVAIIGNGEHGRTIYFGVNTTNTQNPDKSIDGRKHHPDIKPLPLIEETIKYADALDPDRPLRCVQTGWSSDYLGGPNTNYTLYHTALAKMAAENDGMITPEMKIESVRSTLEYRGLAMLGGFTEVVDVEVSDGRVDAYILRPNVPLK